jgi:hypothetical protein
VWEFEKSVALIWFICTAPPAADVMRRVERLFREKRKGTNLNELIRTMRPYQNPSIYEKLIDMMEIDQIGESCRPALPPSISNGLMLA